jgi:rRNA maturation RNase YbeY
VKAATDILSFPTHEFFQRQGMLGDLVLCAPVAIKQAKEIGHSWQKEVDVLLVHGILHLLHFDHETGDRDAKDMSKWESKILGSTYAKSLIQRVHEMAVDVAAAPKIPGKTGKKTTAKVKAKARTKPKLRVKPKAKSGLKSARAQA